MPRFRSLPACLALLGVLLAAGAAHAQSVTISNKQSLLRLTADGKTVTKRQINPEAINYADCLANQVLEINYVTSGGDPNKTLEVWAGQQDCKPIAARTGTTQQCWRPFGNLTVAQTGTIRIPVRNILKRSTGTNVIDATGDPSVCSGISLSTFSLYFMWFQGTGTDPVGTTDQVDIQVKTQGPSALTGLQVLPGNTRLIVTFDAVGEAGVTDQRGIRVYCDDRPTRSTTSTENVLVCPDSGSVADAGATDDAEATDAGVADACVTEQRPVSGGEVCNSSVLAVPSGDGGAPALPDAKYLCAEIGGNTGSRVVVEKAFDAGLANDRYYAVAVAAVDSFDNVGTLSSPVCEAPGETSDFWDSYRRAGGQAGGCSTEGGSDSGALALALPVVAILGALARKRVVRGGVR